MKATLEFNLPEDATDLELAMKAWDLYHFHDEFYQWLRNKCKYSELTKEQSALLTELEEAMDGYRVDIEME